MQVSLAWALPSRGLLWDWPGCFVLTMHIHLQRGCLHGWQEVPTPLTIPCNPSTPSLLVSSHSAAPGTTRAAFLSSQDTLTNASSWAQPEPQALTRERLFPCFVPNPMSSGAEPGEPVPVPGSTAGHGAFSSRLQPKHSA